MKNMSRNVRIIFCVVSIVALAISSSVFAAEKGGKDQELSARQAGFERFAVLKLKQLNRNHKLAPSRMEVVKREDGTYRARYHKIDASSMNAKVRRSSSKQVPYVGILSYHENVYEMSAKSPKAFDVSDFSVVKVIPNRHIFSYQKGAWD